MPASDAQSDYALALTGHAQCFAGLVEQEGPRLHGAGTSDSGVAQLTALRILQLELENINLAFDTSLNLGRNDLLERIARYLYRFLSIKGEAITVRQQYSRLLRYTQQPADTGVCELYARAGLSAALVRLGPLDEARRMAELVGDLATRVDDRAWSVVALRNLGLVEQALGDYAAARRLHTQALEEAQAVGDSYGEAASLSNLGLAEYALGRFEAAKGLLSQALEIWRRRGDVYGEALALQNLGNVATLLNNYAEAIRLFNEGLSTSCRLGNRSGETNALIALGFVDRLQGRHAEATVRLRQARALALDLGDRQLEIAACGNLANSELELREFEAARCSLIRALTLARDVGNRVMQPYLCIPASGLLAVLGMQTAAITSLAGALAQLEALGHELDADDQLLVDAARNRIDQAASESLDASAVANAEQTGNEMDANALIGFVLDWLAKGQA